MHRYTHISDVHICTYIMDNATTHVYWKDFQAWDHGALCRLQIRERSDLWMALSKEAARKICGSVSTVVLVRWHDGSDADVFYLCFTSCHRPPLHQYLSRVQGPAFQQFHHRNSWLIQHAGLGRRLFFAMQVVPFSQGNSGRFIDISMTAWAFAKAGQADAGPKNGEETTWVYDLS